MAELRHPEQVEGRLRLMHLATIQRMARELPHDSGLFYYQNSDAKVHYESWDTLFQFIQRFGRWCLLATVDIEYAFRIIPIQPDDHYFLGFPFNENSIMTCAFRWGAVFLTKSLSVFPPPCNSPCRQFMALPLSLMIFYMISCSPGRLLYCCAP